MENGQNGLNDKETQDSLGKTSSTLARKHEQLRTLVECAIMVALGTVLSLVKVYELPNGGAITLLSMLPVCLVSIRHGLKWGIGTSFVYSLVQTALSIGAIIGWGLTPGALIGTLLFDYLIAFTVLGLAGIFRTHGLAGECGGVALAVFLRFLSHFISGIVIWTAVAPEGESAVWYPVWYSLIYNGSYMLPELILTVIAAPLVLRALKKVKI